MVQRLGLCALIAEGPGSIPGRWTMIPQALRMAKKKEKDRNKKKKKKLPQGRDNWRINVKDSVL